MKNAVHTLLFSIALGAICSALVVGASLFTAPYRDANEKAEKVRNFLAALDVPLDPAASAEEVLFFFERHVRPVKQDGIELFEYTAQGEERPSAVAIPFSGSGVWGPIEGVLALEADRITIRGVRFYRQEETPGLGGEIASAGFQKQFRGKKIVSGTGEPGFKVRSPGTHDAPNTVDAITGATMTSDRVEAMLDRTAKTIGSDG